jgi:hypothetical protein
MAKETMTIQEVCDIFRSAGIRMSPNTVRQGMITGAFDFGAVIKCEKYVFIIYRKKVAEYFERNGVTVR